MTSWHGGKGSTPRKGTYSKQYKDNYDKIFSKKEPVVKEPVVKEPQNPVEGEFSLDQHGEQVQFKDGKWQRSIFP